MSEVDVGVFNTISDGPMSTTLINDDGVFRVRMTRLDGTSEAMRLDRMLELLQEQI